MKVIRSVLVGASLTLPCIAADAAPADGQSTELRMNFDIDSQPLNSALKEWADQTSLQWLGLMEGITDQIVAPSVKGRFTARDALNQLLEGTSLTYEFVNERTVAIRAATQARSSQVTQSFDVFPGVRRNVHPARLHISYLVDGASDGTEVAYGGTHAAQQPTSSFSRERTREIEEIMVTGTHIRGASSRTSPLTVIGQESIARSGYSTTQELFRSLPQNFTGGSTGASEDGPYGAGSSANANNTSASGVNLRGLGTSSTLVLLNGHRIAPSMFGSVVDLSLIPLAAIDRVEIMSSGSSAVYGSDAVAGVINLILKKEFDGSETTVRYGSVANGGRTERLAAHTIGTHWDGGGVVSTLQYHEQGALESNDRSFTSDLPSPNDLYPQTESFGFSLNAQHQFSSEFSWYANALGSRRGVERRMSTASRLSNVDATSQSINVASGVRYSLGQLWALDLGGSYSRNISDSTRTTTGSTAVQTSRTDEAFTQTSIDLVGTGQLFETSTGGVKLALGGSYRTEAPTRHTISVSGGRAERDTSRNISSAFAELSVPLVGPGGGLRAIESLDLSAAVRHDDYSDFGTTSNPRVGLRWQPTHNIAIRASYSRSYRAPNDLELGAGNSQFIFVFPFANPAGGPTVPTFVLAGNSALQPERARTSDVGIEFRPDSIAGLAIDVGYYDIDYRDRIILPPFDTTALLQRDVYGALIENLADDAEAQRYLETAVASGATFFDFGGGVTGVRYVFDGRQHNAALVKQSGYDLDSTYTASLGLHSLTLHLNAAHIEQIRTAFADGATATDLSGTLGNPPGWKIRFDAGWSSDELTVSAAVNYVDSYRNSSSLERSRIDSWTTVDLTARLNLDAYTDAPLFKGLSAALTVQNAFDRDPPFVDAPGIVPVRYDVANANPLGRFIALELHRSWGAQ